MLVKIGVCPSTEQGESSQTLIQKECNSIGDKITYCFNMLFTYTQYNKKSLLCIVAFSPFMQDLITAQMPQMTI